MDYPTTLTYLSPLDMSVTMNNGTLTANVAEASYQWVDCNNNMAYINGETGQSFTPQSDGSYAVFINDSSCAGYSSCYEVTGTGINGSSAGNIKCYLNPTSGNLNIVDTKGNRAIRRFSLMNIDGKVILEHEKPSFDYGELVLDLSGVSTGVYFLRISTDDGDLVVRVVRE